MNDIEIHIQTQFFVDAFKLMGLVDRHLRIAVAVQQKQRWIISIDVGDRAGQCGQIWCGIGNCSQ